MPNQSLDAGKLAAWVGRSETITDQIDIGRAVAMAATLDSPVSLAIGDSLPPLWHWLYFWSAIPASQLGTDGHAQRGEFLPPVTLPRRMWAGGRLKFLAPLPLGAQAERVSRIKAVDVKQGKSGPLVFVTVAHDISVQARLVIQEEHDIVYRDTLQAGDSSFNAKLAPTDAHWSRQISPDPVQLFRYSALTFNGYRIHYDRTYTTEVEGYPGLIVHGPLIASLLTDLVSRELPDRTIAEFSFRAIAPLFDTEPFSVHGRLEPEGKQVVLWAANSRGELAMQAEAQLR
ncbi:MAG: MaoC/PaaZ C-terminal domain-containing protein [Burkholderiales bacterium]|nr:MaoC/PaaZ C-terminal domain-containing protein [Burkholderiales bacterium]